MRIIFEGQNKKLQEPQFFLTPQKLAGGLTEFQKRIIQMIFNNPRLKVIETRMCGKKMAMDIIKKGQHDQNYYKRARRI